MVENFWRACQESTLPVLVIDVTTQFEGIELSLKTKPFNPFKISRSQQIFQATRRATERAAYVFLAECNKHLEDGLRVYVDDHHNAIDELDRVLNAIALQASQYELCITHRHWCVWAGRPAIIKAWEEKLQ